MKRTKKIVVVGAGPGGLTAAMLLAHKGYNVQVYERNAFVGGRNASLSMGGYTFDLGPTFLMMKHILEEMFELCGRDPKDYLKLVELEPLYKLLYSDGREFVISRDRERMLEQIRRFFPGNEAGYKEFFRYEKTKYERLVPCLQVPYEKYSDYLSQRMLRAAPYFDMHKSLYEHLGRYFDNHDLKIAFTFQAKYLGMSPWECPGTFSLIAYLEHGLGIYHVEGGLNQISKAMARVVEEEGGQIHLSTPVRQIKVRNGRAVGVELEGGDMVPADDVIINADFAHAMSTLVLPQNRPHYSDEALANKKYSCSTFMLYLGVDRRYDHLAHHNIFFAPDYQKNVDEIARLKVLSDEPSFYIQNAAITDPTVAPSGKSTIYVLVPVPNNKGPIDWDIEAPKLRNKIIGLMETRGGMPDLRQHIEQERVITPKFWEEGYNVYKGATFNLAHNVGQMLVWRPHNRFEEFENCWLVGGGTHPGSGVPTILESGRISAGLILKRDAWYL